MLALQVFDAIETDYELSRPDDTIIALMGMTGVGKSSFISLFTNEKVQIGTDLESFE
jgi:polynucleotide 5'-kinase involved in rRNA processing